MVGMSVDLGQRGRWGDGDRCDDEAMAFGKEGGDWNTDLGRCEARDLPMLHFLGIIAWYLSRMYSQVYILITYTIEARWTHGVDLPAAPQLSECV
jgi:hypothetical protein